MKIGRYALLGAGIAIGFVLGTRAGRERYDQMAGWVRRTSADLGVDEAVDRVVDTSHEVALDLRETAAERAHDALESGSRAVSGGVKSAGASINPDS